jgi:integrase
MPISSAIMPVPDSFSPARETKNGKPHAIPVPPIAAELIQSINTNELGWFFPSAKDPSKPVSANTHYSFMWRQRERAVIPIVTNRDLRRTWKTLAGKAGVSKEIRDRLSAVSAMGSGYHQHQ